MKHPKRNHSLSEMFELAEQQAPNCATSKELLEKFGAAHGKDCSSGSIRMLSRMFDRFDKHGAGPVPVARAIESLGSAKAKPTPTPKPVADKPAPKPVAATASDVVQTALQGRASEAQTMAKTLNPTQKKHRWDSTERHGSANGAKRETFRWRDTQDQ